jgi:hypothetical protein
MATVLFSLLFFVYGCEKADNAIDNALDFSGIFHTSDGWEIEVDQNGKSVEGHFTKIGTPRSQYTQPKVGDEFMDVTIRDDGQSCSGYTRDEIFFFHVSSEVTLSGSTLTIKPIDGTTSSPYTFTKGSGTNNNNSGDMNGVWVRIVGASGHRTDLAIGNIPGAPSNRVFMCEKPGSSAAGLYKGYLSGNTITFDAQYGLPTYNVKKEGNKVIVTPNASSSLPTPYEAGSWGGDCGALSE